MYCSWLANALTNGTLLVIYLLFISCSTIKSLGSERFLDRN